MARLIPGTLLLIAAVVHLVPAPAAAARPGEELLPATTKGFLSIPDLDQLRERWERTQLGELMNDPAMAPFIEDVREQIRSKMNETEVRLGLTWEDLEDTYGGEICVAVIQPWDAEAAAQKISASVSKSVSAARSNGKSEDEIAAIRSEAEAIARREQRVERLTRKALALLVDVTDHQTQAEQLLKKVFANLTDRGAVRRATTLAGIQVTQFTFPLQDGESEARLAFYCLHKDHLIATDHPGIAASILGKLEGTADEAALADLPAFHATRQHSREAMGDTEAQIRWFVEPFGYVEALRAFNGGRKRRGMDFLQVLINQGFSAIQGLGGLVALATDKHEIVHRSFVFAPPLEPLPGAKRGGKYRLAANMLDFPNSPRLKPPSWVPADVASYLTFNWKMRDAFEHAKTLVNEIAGDEVFEDVLKSIETDPNGPRINLRTEMVAHLAERATLIADYREPVTPQSERILFAIELTNPPVVMKTVNKAMESDPAAKKRSHQGHVIWEILNEDPVEVETIQIDGAGFGFGFEEPPEPIDEEEPFIPNSAITVAHGHLLVASHLDYIVEVLEQPAPGVDLDNTSDFARVNEALDDLGAGNDSFRLFSRTDQAYHPTYELLRQNKMPQSETMFGKLLNRLFEPDEEGEVRQQQIDGAKMPSFDKVRQYLGPTGAYIHSEDQGWSVSGCLLKKTE